jgi:DNA-binding FadR family transcriptional regulator
LRFSIRTTNRYKGVRLASVSDHKRVADAIISGNSEAAETTMRELIREALELIKAADIGTARPDRSAAPRVRSVRR